MRRFACFFGNLSSSSLISYVMTKVMKFAFIVPFFAGKAPLVFFGKTCFVVVTFRRSTPRDCIGNLLEMT